MVRTGRRAVVATIGASLALPGCVGLLDDESEGDEDESGDDDFVVDPSQWDAGALQSDAIDAMEALDTYTFHTEQVLELTDADGEIDVVIDADGRAIDSETRTHVESVADVQMDSGNLAVPGEAYYVGDRAFLENDGEWDERALDEPWSAAQKEADLLTDADASVADGTTVHGTDAVVLDVEPVDAGVVDYGFPSSASPDPRPDDPTVEAASASVAVAAEAPHYVLRSEVDLTVAQDDKTVEATFETTFDDVGSDVSIDLPEAIQTAVDR